MRMEMGGRFKREGIYVLEYDTYLSLSESLHSLQSFLGSSTSSELTRMCFFLWLSNILLCKCTTSSLSIHLSMDI